MALTDAGVANLAALPWLEQIEIYSSPKVSRNIAQPFRDTLRAQFRLRSRCGMQKRVTKDGVNVGLPK